MADEQMDNGATGGARMPDPDLYRKPDHTFELYGEHTTLLNGEQLDPFRFDNYETQLKEDQMMQDTNYTPLDFSVWVQTMKNPKTQAGSQNFERITVQRVHQHIKQYDDNVRDSRRCWLGCGNKEHTWARHEAVPGENVMVELRNCDYSTEAGWKPVFYKCTECKSGAREHDIAFERQRLAYKRHKME